MTSSVATKMQTVFPSRAIAYLHAPSGTVNLPRQFKGLGSLLAYSVPLGTAVTAVLMPPVGPRAQGNPLRATITGGAGADVVVFEC